MVPLVFHSLLCPCSWCRMRAPANLTVSCLWRGWWYCPNISIGLTLLFGEDWTVMLEAFGAGCKDRGEDQSNSSLDPAVSNIWYSEAHPKHFAHSWYCSWHLKPTQIGRLAPRIVHSRNWLTASKKTAEKIIRSSNKDWIRYFHSLIQQTLSAQIESFYQSSYLRDTQGLWSRCLWAISPVSDYWRWRDLRTVVIHKQLNQLRYFQEKT